MKRGLKYLLILVAGILLLLVLLLLFTQTTFFKNKVKERAIQLVKNEYNLTLDIEELQGNFYDHIVVQNITLSNNDSIIAVLPLLQLDYDLWELSGRIISIDSVLVDNPQVFLWQKSDSTWNVSNIHKTSEKAVPKIKKPFNFEVRTKHLGITNASVSISSFLSVIPQQINHLNLVAKAAHNKKETSIHLKTFEFKTEKPAFVLNNLSGIYTMNGNGIQLDSLLLLSGGSSIDLNAMFESKENMSSIIDASRIDKNELAIFVPSLKLLCSPSLQANFTTSNDSVIAQAELSYNNQSVNADIKLNTLSNLIAKKQAVSYSAELNFNNFRIENWIETKSHNALIVGEIQLQGSNLLNPNGFTTITADLHNSIYRDVVFDTLTFNGIYGNDSLNADLDIYTNFGNVQISGKMKDISDSLFYKAKIISEEFDVTTFVPKLKDTEVSGVIQAEGQLSNPKKYVSNATLNLVNSSIYYIPIDSLQAKVNMQGTAIFLDSLELTVPGAVINGSGNFNLDSLILDTRVYAKITSMECVDSFVTLPITFDSLTTYTTVSGNVNNLNIGGDVEIFNAVGYSMELGRADAQYLVELIPDSLNVHVNTWAYYAESGPIDWDTASVDVNYAKSKVDAIAYLNWRDTLTANIAASITTKDTMQLIVPKFEINSLVSNFYMSDTMKAQIYEREKVEIENFHFKDKNRDEFLLSINGVLSASDSNKVHVLARELDLSQLNRLLAEQDSIKGFFETEIDLLGTAENPFINGSAHIRNPEYGVYGLSSVETKFRFENQRGFAELTSNDMGKSFFASISADVKAYFDSLNFVLDVPNEFEGKVILDSVDISKAIAAFIPNDSLYGIINGKIDASGDWKNPLFYGGIDVTEAKYVNKSLGIDYEDIKTSVVFDGNKILLDTALVQQKNGLISISGEVEFDSTIIRGNITSSSLELDANKFFLTKHRNYEILLDANTFIKTNNQKPEFGGKIKVLRSDVYLPALLSDGKTDIDNDVPLLVEALKVSADSVFSLETVEKLKGEKEKKIGAYSNVLTGRLNIEIPRNTWIKSDDMRVELSGEVEIVKTGAYFEIFGNIDIVRGHYILYGRKLNLTESQIVFQGGEKLDPTLNIVAEYIYRGSDKEKRYLELLINGEMSEPDITFLLDGTEITETDGISILVFGATSDEIGYGGQNGLIGSVGSNAVASVLTSQLSRTVGTQLKLDMIEITATESWQSAAFVVGKYITNDIFVIYQRGFGEVDGDEITPETITVEYELSENLFLRLQSGSSKESGVDVILKFEQGKKIEQPFKRNK